ncbi:tRNA pseudouridine synthase C [Enhygromyxa salina]|uniref:tRNA pseudouridine synthase C n=1 Tax=Enhygromyxa salina TaxID=215803 RepID=A0A2S9YE80_9BACT|nr:pseudouridine synthase [Enhygromyxa salina]PRQ03316.1 tRNA pseudouridine synthase C [Enhygromyxa salina]
MPEPLELIHQDACLVAVNKPSGMLVHRGWAQDDVVAVDLLHAQLGRRVWPLHRLDRGTSGVLLFALDADSARQVSAAFEAGEVNKRYLALVRGQPPAQLRIDYSLRRVDSSSKQRRPAQTELRHLATVTIAQDDAPGERRYSLVDAIPLTGRTHQIRRHLKHASHPIIGDVRYGKGAHNRLFRARFGLHRLALHAAELSLPHPLLGHEISLRAPLPGDLADPLAAMGFTDLR